MTVLHDDIVAARDRGDADYRDALLGPVRLEDVFASVIEKAQR
jgi:hypothetical protein